MAMGNQFAHYIRMSDSDPKDNTPTVTIAEKAGFLDNDFSHTTSMGFIHVPTNSAIASRNC